MPKPSPVSVAFHDAFDASFLPLLKTIGLTPTKPTTVQPGLVVALAARALADGRRLEVCLWCNGGTGDHLRMRVDVIGVVNGVESSKQIDLEVPWPDASAPRPPSLDFSGNQFLPGQDTEQLRKAIAFLAGGLAGSLEELAKAVPELGGELRARASDERWAVARNHAADLWRARHTRGEVDTRSCPATVVFVGANLVTLTADNERLTFRFDTRDFDRTAPLTVSGWTLTPAGTRRATRLTAGERTWHFDHRGALTNVTKTTAPA